MGIEDPGAAEEVVELVPAVDVDWEGKEDESESRDWVLVDACG